MDTSLVRDTEFDDIKFSAIDIQFIPIGTVSKSEDEVEFPTRDYLRWLEEQVEKTIKP